jgi:hypothetical protein
MWSLLRTTLLDLSSATALEPLGGFAIPDPAAQRRLASIVESFVSGYGAALRERDPDRLVSRLDSALPPSLLGFAFEGAGMGLGLVDCLVPPRARRLGPFLDGPARRHAYLVHVGVGWAWARTPRPLRARARGLLLAELEPRLTPLFWDGVGFHDGFFRARTVVEEQFDLRPTGYAARAYDQGLGRCLWFVRGTRVGAVAATIRAFPRPRRRDLWSGAGLACAYAGGDSPAAALDLVRRAEECAPEVAQGIAFAAAARAQGLNPTAECERACAEVWGRSAADLAEQVEALAPNGAAPEATPRDEFGGDYEEWRAAVQASYAPLPTTSPCSA